MNMSFKIDDIEYEIASPCEANWNEMVGDDKCRHCSLCDKNVYNFSAMTEDEVIQLIKKDSNICTRVYKRDDGTVLTQDCPIGLALVKKQLRKRQFMLAFATLMSLTVMAFAKVAKDQSSMPMGEMGIVAPPMTHEVEVEKPSGFIKGKMIAPKEEHFIMGDIAVDPGFDPEYEE